MDIEFNSELPRAQFRKVLDSYWEGNPQITIDQYEQLSREQVRVLAEFSRAYKRHK